MITDNDSNFVYFSDLLNTMAEFEQTCQKLTSILEHSEIKFGFLKGTKDIWARDYMPIQVSENKFIEYRYDPDYLQAKKYRKIKSYPDMICDLNSFKTIKTDLIIDGGNIIKSSDCVILTDKFIVENKDSYSKEALIGKIKELFEIDKVALIPWDKENDYLGHADGMVRFITNNKVLIQGYFDSYAENFKDKFFGELVKNGITWEKMNFDVEIEDDRSWAYLNFLQTKELILIPSFGIDEDNQAIRQIKKHFPDYSDNKIKQIDMKEIVKKDGALNCISWTIKI